MFQYAQPQRPEFSLPGWLIFLRIAQGALAVVSLILSAIAAAKFVDDTADPTTLVSAYPGFGFCWFAFAWSAVYLPAAIFVIPRIPDKIKSIVMLFILDVLSTLWWLVTFGLLTSAAVSLTIGLDMLVSILAYDPSSKIDQADLDTWNTGLNFTRACVAFVGLEFLLFAVMLAFVSMILFRKSGSQGSNFAMSHGTTVNEHEHSKEAQQAVPYPVGGAELSVTRSP